MELSVMSRSFPSALAASQIIVRALIVLNLAVGTLIFALSIASVIARDQVFAALGADVANASLIHGMRLIMVIGVGSAPPGPIFLNGLLPILAEGQPGGPFLGGQR